MNCDDVSLSIQKCNINRADHKTGVHRAASRKPQHARRSICRQPVHRPDEASQTGREVLCYLELTIVPS